MRKGGLFISILRGRKIHGKYFKKRIIDDESLILFHINANGQETIGP